jgi:hypothetical protein
MRKGLQNWDPLFESSLQRGIFIRKNRNLVNSNQGSFHFFSSFVIFSSLLHLHFFRWWWCQETIVKMPRFFHMAFLIIELRRTLQGIFLLFRRMLSVFLPYFSAIYRVWNKGLSFNSQVVYLIDFKAQKSLQLPFCGTQVSHTHTVHLLFFLLSIRSSAKVMRYKRKSASWRKQ